MTSTGRQEDWVAGPALTRSEQAAADEVAAAVQVRRTRSRRRPSGWLIFLCIGLLSAAATISAAAVDADAGTDLLALLRSVAVEIGGLRWQYAAVVVCLGAAHYLATAIAARAAAGVRLPLGEAVLVQFAAAAANRLTPAGLGGSAINARYMTRRGLHLPAAIGAVTALGVLGVAADVLVLGAIIVAGSWFGLNGASGELRVLVSKVAHLGSALRSPWLWGVVAVVGLAVGWRLRRRGAAGGRSWREFWVPIRELGRDPRRLLTLIAASGSTTLVLAVAFGASTAMVPGPQPRAGLGALLVAFMIGAAAGSAVPVPAGLGSTEAALIGVLMTAQVPAGNAVRQVLIFRLITFWAPAIVGVLASRYLYRRRAI
jgi:uncharacterized membrane protein YbhN (UPF0104 family)